MSTKLMCCYNCLGGEIENSLSNYLLQSEHLRTIFQEDTIVLCYICKRLVQYAEMFISNVLKNQVLMECIERAEMRLEDIKSQVKTSINLIYQTLPTIMLSGNNVETEEQFVTVCNKDIAIKLEIKDELELANNVNRREDDAKSDDNFDDGNFINEIFSGDNVDTNYDELYVKNEDKTLNEILKVEYEDASLMSLSKALRIKKRKTKEECKLNKKVKKKDITEEDLGIMSHVERLYMTRKQCLQERAELAKDEKYMTSVYKCTDCLKGFRFKPSYERHLELHSESSGPYECNICKQRKETKDKLEAHKKLSHVVRYRCKECGLTRKNSTTIKDHYTAFHCQKLYQFVCPHCTKSFTRSCSLRKHVNYSHTKRRRVLCQYCHKYYANNDVLKSHLILSHPKEVSAVEKEKKYSCQECHKAFKSPSLLKKHMIKHSTSRDAYCVECDKSFKSEYSLQQHLKIAAPHVNNRDKPIQCGHCDKRFSIRRDVELHMNRVHLNLRPYKCDLCDKEYSSPWSLKHHRRVHHEGYKRPLQFPCDMCDKVFDRIQILRSHVRTHTGERPYQCSQCDATFAQSSTLRTHMKLIHLKLTRDGKPKHGKC